MGKQTADIIAFEERVTSQERAIIHLWNHPLFERLLKPICRPRDGSFTNGVDEINWSKLGYGVLSGGEQAALSWAWGIWTDEVNPEFRDPFDGFRGIDRKLQKVILEAMEIRHDMNRPPDPWDSLEE